MQQLQTIVAVLAVLAAFDLFVYPFLGRGFHGWRHGVRTNVYRKGRHFSALRRLPFTPHSHVRHAGRHHPVNGHWRETHIAPWRHLAAHTHEELVEIKDELLKKSDETSLTDDEVAYLFAVRDHINVRRSLNLLGDRDHRDFGFEGVDQLHFNVWNAPDCGCRLVHVFDHHKRGRDDHEHHEHPPLRLCPKHAPHRHLDLRALRALIEADAVAAAQARTAGAAKAAEAAPRETAP